MIDIGPESPVSSRRCPLCNGLMAVRQHGNGAAEFRFVHTDEDCRALTTTRIANLESWQNVHLAELRDLDAKIRSLGAWIGTMSAIVQAAIPWLDLRDQLRARNGSITSSIETEQLEGVLRDVVQRVNVSSGKV